MKLTAFAIGALATLVSAHSDLNNDYAGLPKLMGGRAFLSELKARGAHQPHLHSQNSVLESRQTGETPAPRKRANAEGTCGPQIGSCDVGECCSPEGYCGVGKEYCAAPDCQYQYGPACDTNQIPSGVSTANVPRPKVGSVSYGGGGIYDCAVAGDIAFTFDDGPYLYTSDLLDKLKVYDAKATFFITGNNLGKGPIDSTAQWSNLIKRMVAEGHQIASHTWGHQDLSVVDNTTFYNQIIYNEMAFRNILGYFPTYMRPPYSSCNDKCASNLANLGYHVTYFDLDTAGYLNDDPKLIQNSKNIWDKALAGTNPKTKSFLEIEHDIHYQTVYNLTDYILASMYKNGYKSVTVGDCLADPAANWYRTPGAAPPQAVSQDGTCSASVTCSGSAEGPCCSVNGFCGSTADYCGTGCQPDKGTCVLPSTTSAAVPTSTAIVVSTDGSCSSTTTCLGSEFGDCCSQYNFCGSTTDYCDAGCQPLRGNCGLSTSSSSSSSVPLSSSSSTSISSTLSSASSSTSSTATSSSSSSSSSRSSSSSSSSSSTSSIRSTAASVSSVTSTSVVSTSSSSSSSIVSLSSSSISASSSSSSSSRPISTLSSSLTPTTAPPIISTTSSATTPTATPKGVRISPDGTCGGTTGYTCLLSRWGACCSKAGRCGNIVLGFSQPYCFASQGCQRGFGLCI